MLTLSGVSYRYPGALRDALSAVSLHVGAGEFHAVLGPNGSGKTTLVRVALGAVKPDGGQATIADRPAHAWPRQELARLVGVVPQREDNLFPQRVRETVLLGRYPHLTLWGGERPEDQAAVDRALTACDVPHLADRWVWTLSGGEYQRVRVARALAQEPQLVVLALAQQPKDTVVVKPVVVTATRTPATADVLPAAVTVLKGADLTAKGIRTVAQALETVPGLHIAATGSIGGQTAIFTRGGESDYTKVLLDGVPLNQAGGGIDLAHLTTDNVDRIEIVRGPVSVLYGSDAMTGVVQGFTKAGAGSRESGAGRLGAEFRGGTYGSAEEALDFAGGTPRVSYSASASRFSSDGLYSYNNQYRNSVASARVVARPDARSDVSLTYRYGDDRYHFPTDGFGAPVDSNQRAAERGPLLSLSAGRELGQHLDARVTVAAKESRQFFNDEPDSPGEDGAFRSRDYVRRTTSSALVTWRANGASLVGGVEYEDQRQHGTSDFSASFGDFPDSIHVQRNNTGYFTEALLPAGPTVWTLGARLDDNSQFGAHGTYRAGLVYRLTEQMRLRVSAGTGFKEPTFFENYAHGFVKGTPNLRPEQSFSWEVGAERGPVTVTYFNQRFRDLVEYSPTPVGPDSVNYFNVGAAVADGIEASAVYSLTRAIVFSLNYTFLHTRVEKSGTPSDPNALFVPGKPLVRRPVHVLAPELTASLGDRAHVTVGLVWVGKRDDVGAQRVTLDPYTRLNASAEYALGHVVLTGTITNALNDQSQEINGFRPLGRVVMLGARVAIGR